jgi:hypothetical protein
VTEKNLFTGTEIASLSDMDTQVSGSSPTRFLQTCIDYYREWADAHSQRLKSGQVPADRALIMVYAELPLVDIDLHKTTMSPQRTRRATRTLESGVAVCNENLEVMLRVEPEGMNADEAMEYVSSRLKIDHAFALLLMAEQRILIHGPGEDIEEWCNGPRAEKIELNHVDVTPDSIAEALTIFHSEQTAKPLGITARLMWDTKAAAPKLHSLPELRVQSSLLTYLKGKYSNARVVVDEEIKNPGGRVDIRVHRFKDANRAQSVTTMLELKVLKPEKSQQWNLDWAMQSLTQANDYRLHDTDTCFSCLFDARKDKSDPLSALDPKAVEMDVRLSRYLMEVPVITAPKPVKDTSSSPSSAETISTGSTDASSKTQAQARQRQAKPRADRKRSQRAGT